MGLDERRRIAAIKDGHTARYNQQLNTALGFQVPFEIDAATFPENKTVLDCYDSYFDSYGPGLVVKVLQEICKDKFGRDTVKEKIKKVVFQNTAKSPEVKGHKEVELDSKGVLYVRESFYGYSDLLFGEDDLKNQIEQQL